MTNEQIDIWTKALRSGDFKQARNVISQKPIEEKEGNAFCCIGVAAHLFGVEVEYDNKNSTEEACKALHIPFVVSEDATQGGIGNTLVVLNDFNYNDFPTIADFIDQNRGALLS